MTDSEIAIILRRLDEIEPALERVVAKLDEILGREERERIRAQIRGEVLAEMAAERAALDAEDTQERLRADLLHPRHRSPHIDLPDIVTPATPGEPAQRKSSSRRHADRPTAGERVLGLVERHPYPTLGALVLVVAIVYGVVPQLVELAQVAGSAAVDSLPIPDPFRQEPAP